MMEAAGDCMLPDTHTTLQRLWDVISDKHSSSHLNRQLLLLDAFLKVTEERVHVKDLQLLSRVLTFFVSKEGVYSEYRKPLQNILNLLKHPPTMKKFSEKVEFEHYLVEFFSTLGCLFLQTNNKNLQTQIFEIVEIILLIKRDKGTNMVPADTCIKCLEVSEFVECLSDALAVVDEIFYPRVVHTAIQICSKSEYCCWTLLSRGAIDTLLIRLNSFQKHDRLSILDITSQLLWKLFSCTSHPEDWLKVETPSKLALRSLRYVLREVALLHILPGHAHLGLNNIAVIILKLMNLFPNAAYVLSGITEDIVYFATATEAVVFPKMVPNFKTEKDRLMFKKIMLSCLSLSPISTLSVELFKKYKVAECLISLIDCQNCRKSRVSWTPQNANNLIQFSLPVICELFNCLCKEFIEADLMTTLVQFLRSYYVEKKESKLDDLVHLMIKVLALLCSRKEAQKALTDAEGVQVFLEVCTKIVCGDSSLTLPTQSVLLHSLNVLAGLFENNKDLQRNYCKTSLKIVTTLYKRIVKPLVTDSLIDNRLILAVANFVWEALVWNDENVLKFISSGNIFLHIDILERSPLPVQLVMLSVLVDVCECHQSIPYLVSWRGREGIKLLSILCKVWRAEEDCLRVSRSEEKCVLNTESPLMGEDQFELTESEKSIISPHAVYGSVRPKIYAIFQLLNRHKDVTELCEEHYKLGYDKVCTEDQVTLELIKAYLPLKMGEVWWEIKKKQQEVLPLDRYLAHTLADRYLNWSQSVQRAQHRILDTRDAQWRSEEMRHYAQMRSGHLTSALEALQEVVTIARSADRQILLETNRRRREGLEASRAPVMDFRPAYTADDNLLLVDNTVNVVVSLHVNHSSASQT